MMVRVDRLKKAYVGKEVYFTFFKRVESPDAQKCLLGLTGL